MSRRNPTLSRRSFLGGAVGAGALLGSLGGLRPLISETLNTSEDHRFIGCFMNGGWDVLLGPDARDPGGSYAGIDLGTELLATEYKTPINVMLGGTETLLGAAMAPLVPHLDVVTIFRGVNMNTVAHSTGRAYVNSFVSPAGVQTRGSSLATVASSVGPLFPDRTLPNVSIGVPSFNSAYPSELTAVPLSSAPEIIELLQPGSVLLSNDVETLLLQAQDEVESCISKKYTGEHPADALKAARERVRKLLKEDVARFFDLGGDDPDIVDLRARYGLDVNTHRSNRRDPRVVAAVVSQLIKTGLSRSVTCQLQGSLDDHSGVWASNQPLRQEAAYAALNVLLSDLRADDPAMVRTTLVVYSEFARTPLLNGQQGRDHWFANSMMVFGGNIKAGVFGASRLDNLGLQTVNLETGLPDEEGTMLLPEHVGATIIAGMGGDASPFRVTPLNSLLVGGGA